MKSEAGYFLAGVLSHIREITAFLNSTENSYQRFGKFEAPLYIGWSYGNRSQLVRIPHSADASRSRIELRSPDPCCNQYSALALIIAAGMEWIEKKLALPEELVINTYKANGGNLNNLNKALYSNFKNKAGWLEYNLKRVCELECLDEEEQKLGEKEVVRVIDEILMFYNSIKHLINF